MRTKPASFRPVLGIQWACAAADRILGLADLSALPALLSGFGSVLDHPTASAFSRAAFNLRHMGVDLSSEIQLRQAVQRWMIWEDENRGDPSFVEPPYDVFVRGDGRFGYRCRTSPHDPAVAEMVAALSAPLPFEAWTAQRADETRPMKVPVAGADGGDSIAIDLTGVPPLPVPAQHDLTIPPRGPITVTFDDLLTVADRLDAMDAADPERTRGNWRARLVEADGARKFSILVPDRGGGRLLETNAIRLEKAKHLLGLPGTGKTTLIVLLLMWLDANGYRAVVLLPSIEASLNLLADLRHYGADAGLLVGQSPETRIEHARKMAERIAAADDARGFGRTAPGADLLALNCALGSFVSDPDDRPRFPHLMPPCTRLRQTALKRDGSEGREGDRLCTLSGCCGRLRAPRELASRRIWLGHVLSLDTRISPHFAAQMHRYVEAVAMASDLVIVDEADGAQAVLDAKALSTLDLTGSEESYDSTLLEDLFGPLARGRNDLTASNVQSYVSDAADFGDLNRRLVLQIQRDRRRSGVLATFEDRFVTSNSVVTELFLRDDWDAMKAAQRLDEMNRLDAVRALWDGCMKVALFRRTLVDGAPDEFDFDPVRIAGQLGVPQSDVEVAATRIVEALRDWLNEPVPRNRDTAADAARDAMFALVAPRPSHSAEQATALFRFLAGTTAVIMQFLTLLPAQQAMVAEGIHTTTLFKQGISTDLSRLVPESLVGRLSGLRFHYGEERGRPTVQLKYVAFRGAPRALLYRLHHLLRHDGQPTGPAVLLASATSFLAESPTFHIPVGPDLVLRRREATQGWRRSEWRFEPIPDPQDPSRFLRYSGAPIEQRERILRRMVDHFYGGENPRVLRMTRDFDPGRKVAFVVNSYQQVRWFKDHLRRTHPALADRTVGVTDRTPENNDGTWVTASQVERLGVRPDGWDAIVFPMKSLARGVNVVFEAGPRTRDALIGTVVFMIRPHPALESLDLVAGLAGSRTLAFDLADHPPGADVAELDRLWRGERRELLAVVRRLLRFPVQASRLGDLAVPFTADIMVDILQTVGRAMRNGCPARAVFVDAAWAPLSAIGKVDGPRSSMLVTMRNILRARVNDADLVDAEIYRALYEPFLHPLERCSGVRFHAENEDDDE